MIWLFFILVVLINTNCAMDTITEKFEEVLLDNHEEDETYNQMCDQTEYTQSSLRELLQKCGISIVTWMFMLKDQAKACFNYVTKLLCTHCCSCHYSSAYEALCDKPN